MWQWKKIILVCCTGICCRDSIELRPKQHVHSVLEAWTLAVLVFKFRAVTQENASSRYVVIARNLSRNNAEAQFPSTQNTLSRKHLLSHPALRWLQSHLLWKVLFWTSKGESSCNIPSSSQSELVESFSTVPLLEVGFKFCKDLRLWGWQS